MTHALARLMFCITLSVSGCAGLSDTCYYNLPNLPVAECASADSTLNCLADRLGHAPIQPFVIGYYTDDVSDETDVNLRKLIGQALQRYSASGTRRAGFASHTSIAAGLIDGKQPQAIRGTLVRDPVPDQLLDVRILGVRVGEIPFTALPNPHVGNLYELSVGATLIDFASGLDIPGGFRRATVTYRPATSADDSNGFIVVTLDEPGFGHDRRLQRSVDPHASLLAAVALAVDVLVADLVAQRPGVTLEACARETALEPPALTPNSHRVDDRSDAPITPPGIASSTHPLKPAAM